MNTPGLPHRRATDTGEPDLEPPPRPATVWRRAFWNPASRIGGALGFAYGLSARMMTEGRVLPGFVEMTFAFLVIVPIVLGVLTVWWERDPSGAFRTVAPWVPMSLVIATVALIGWEGSICVVMAAPLLLALSSIGGLIGAALRKSRRHRGTLPVLLVLPYVAAPAEGRLALPERHVETVTEIEIAAPPSVVWPLVASVDSIRADERRPALFLAMGFPRPVAATLSHAGVGGVRVATFEGGLVFTETVTDWEPGRRLRFSISANGDAIPPGTLDEHVTLGGEYFDVLSGTYELHPLANGARTRLVLRSEHRVNTHVNPYAAWWSNRVMTSIHRHIQGVHKERAERIAGTS